MLNLGICQCASAGTLEPGAKGPGAPPPPDFGRDRIETFSFKRSLIATSPPGFSDLPTAMFKTRKLQFQVFAHLEIWVRKQGQIKWGPKVAGAALLPVGQAGSTEVLIFILLNSNGAKQHFFELPSQVYHGFSC